MTLLLPKPEIIRRPAHLALVRQLPCCLSMNPFNVQAHHLLRVPNHEKCMGRKSGDNWVLPIRADLHRQLHDGPDDERKFLRDHGLRHPLTLATRLWALTEAGLKGEAWLCEGRKILEE